MGSQSEGFQSMMARTTWKRAGSWWQQGLFIPLRFRGKECRQTRGNAGARLALLFSLSVATSLASVPWIPILSPAVISAPKRTKSPMSLETNGAHWLYPVPSCGRWGKLDSENWRIFLSLKIIDEQNCWHMSGQDSSSLTLGTVFFLPSLGVFSS